MKDIVGYEWLYAITEDWKVWSYPKHRDSGWCEGKFLNGSTNNYWYKYLKLFKDKKSFFFQIHRIVATAFIPNPENKRTVNHKNWIRDDNRLENLEWATHSENCLHGFRENWRTLTEKQKKVIQSNWFKNWKQVAQFDKNGNLIKIWCSAAQTHRDWWFDRTSVCSVCRWDSYTHKGFIWKYI